MDTVIELAEGIQRILDNRGVSVESENWIQWNDVPLPYRSLLVHKNDMTSTLENYYGSRIGLEVLDVRDEGSLYLREVILIALDADKAVEYGAIEIDLDQFTPEQREVILAGEEPLGGILNRFKTAYTSGPLGYLELDAPDICKEKFGIADDVKLYGRYNRLIGSDGGVFASIVEILPR